MPRAARGSTADAAGRDSSDLDQGALEPLARAALEEGTPASTVGALRDIMIADDVATVRFATRQGGYLGWFWTVSIAVNPGMEPSVLESELMPGEGALTAPDWVPWSDRLEDYLAQQAADAQSAGSADDQDSDEDHDHDEHDLHGDDGDDVFDGVDIDSHLDSDDNSDDDSTVDSDR